MNMIIAEQHDRWSLPKLAERMKQAALRDPATSPPVYSANEEKALQNARRQGVMAIILARVQNGDLAYIDFMGLTVSLDLTVECFDATHQWHLSMGKCGKSGIPEEVPPHVAQYITDAFFDGKAVEGPRSTGFKNVRHFFAPLKRET